MKKGKFQTNWNFKLFYKGENDPQIEKDLRVIENACRNFEKKYRSNMPYLNDGSSLKRALQDYERLRDDIGSSKPVHYFHLQKDIDASNTVAEARINKFTDRLVKASNRILFFELNLGKVSPIKQKIFLKSTQLSHFHYFLKQIFDIAKYNLTESEEKVMSLKSLPAHSMWINSFDKFLSKQEVTFKGKRLPLSEANSKINTLALKDRRKLMSLITAKLRALSDFSEAELNAIYTDKKISDELRGFKNPYDSTLLSYQTSEKLVMNLVKTVTNNFHISHKFYRLKAKLLKLPYLQYADRSVGIGKIKKKISWVKGLKIIEAAFEKVDPQYRAILDQYLQSGQIDVFPKKGKTGGAYCAGGLNVPTFILLNHIPNINSIMTLGHEMGHAIHTERSKEQTALYQEYTIAAAETASTLFENFVFEEIFEKLSDKEKVVALHDRINDDISSIFRQIACFNFELELHLKIREKGSLPKEDIAVLMNKHMKNYMGPKMILKENDGYFFVNWSHIRRFFYVYTYGFGQLISKSLYQRYKANRNFIRDIEKFLRAGGSASPEAIFKSIGIDIGTPRFFENGLKGIEEDIDRLEKLAKKAKLMK